MSKNCEACSGRGVISWATEDVICSACNGTGNASGKGKATDAAKDEQQASSDNR